MKFALADRPDGYHISAYSEQGILISGKRFSSSLVVLPDRLIEGWRPTAFEQLAAGDFDDVIAQRPDLVLLGTGATQQFPPAEIMAHLISAGIGIEVMDTPAACRTYNILLGEGRRVAAALLMIS